MAFEKGQSGNPNGRPKTTEEFKKLLKDNTTKALNALIKIIDNPFGDDKDKIAASKVILDKALGQNYRLFNDEEEFEDNYIKVKIVKAKKEE